MPSLRNKPRVKRKLLKDRREREKMKASSRVVTQGCIHEYTDGVESKSVEQNEVNAASANQNDNGWQEIPDSDSKTNQSKRPIDFNSHDKILSERMDPKTQLPVNPISLKGKQVGEEPKIKNQLQSDSNNSTGPSLERLISDMAVISRYATLVRKMLDGSSTLHNGWDYESAVRSLNEDQKGFCLLKFCIRMKLTLQPFFSDILTQVKTNGRASKQEETFLKLFLHLRQDLNLASIIDGRSRAMECPKASKMLSIINDQHRHHNSKTKRRLKCALRKRMSLGKANKKVRFRSPSQPRQGVFENKSHISTKTPSKTQHEPLSKLRLIESSKLPSALKLSYRAKNASQHPLENPSQNPSRNPSQNSFQNPSQNAWASKNAWAHDFLTPLLSKDLLRDPERDQKEFGNYYREHKANSRGCFLRKVGAVSGPKPGRPRRSKPRSKAQSQLISQSKAQSQFKPQFNSQSQLKPQSKPRSQLKPQWVKSNLNVMGKTCMTLPTQATHCNKFSLSRSRCSISPSSRCSVLPSTTHLVKSIHSTMPTKRFFEGKSKSFLSSTRFKSNGTDPWSVLHVPERERPSMIKRWIKGFKKPFRSLKNFFVSLLPICRSVDDIVDPESAYPPYNVVLEY